MCFLLLRLCNHRTNAIFIVIHIYNNSAAFDVKFSFQPKMAEKEYYAILYLLFYSGIC